MAVKREFLTDFLARMIVGILFTLLTINVLLEFRRTGHLTGLLLIASESLVVVFTVIRRRAHIVDRSVAGGVVTVLSLIGPSLFRAGAAPGLAPDAVTAGVSAVGLAVVVAGKLTLGRSFGLVPANRGVVVEGPYTVVRHPIYAGYILTHLAFLVAHPQILNVLVIAVCDTALIARSLIEERVLGHDEAYQAYCRRVGWHLVPGLF